MYLLNYIIKIKFSVFRDVLKRGGILYMSWKLVVYRIKGLWLYYVGMIDWGFFSVFYRWGDEFL